MESLKENRPLLWSIVASISAVTLLVLGSSPDLCSQFSIVEFPAEVRDGQLHSHVLPLVSQFQPIVLGVLAADLMSAFVVDRILCFLFGHGKLRLY